MRIGKSFDLDALGRGAGHSRSPRSGRGGRPRTQRPAAEIGKTLRDTKKPDALPEDIVLILVNTCRHHFPGDSKDTAKCVEVAFYNVCPISAKSRYFTYCKDISTRLRLLGYTEVPEYACAGREMATSSA